MSNIIVYAHVLHRTATRLRFRVPGRRYDLEFFEALKHKLAGCEGVAAVDVNPLTASVLVVHGGELTAANLRLCGVHLAGVAPSSGKHIAPPFSYLSGRGGVERSGLVKLSLIAKLLYAAMTGRLGAQILELALEWLAEALMGAVFAPARPPAAAVLVTDLAGPRRQRHSLAAAA